MSNLSSNPAASAATSPSQLERLGDHLKKLRLHKSSERLEALLQHAAANELPYADFLEQVLGEEVAAKRSQNITMRTAMARFPFVKPLETFDFSYQPYSLGQNRAAERAGGPAAHRPDGGHPESVRREIQQGRGRRLGDVFAGAGSAFGQGTAVARLVRWSAFSWGDGETRGNCLT